MRYHYKFGVVKERFHKFFLLSIALFFVSTIAVGIYRPAYAEPTTQIVTGNTVDESAGENGSDGWWFNRDQTTMSPYEFTEDQASIGEGSLHVLPIGANPSDKFIAENFIIGTPVSDIDSISYDFLIAGSGDQDDAEQFYLNVYANLPTSSETNYYDCRFDYVPSSGSTTEFTTATFAASDTPTDVRSRNGATCPETLAAMPADSTVRMFSLSVGDTSASDQGLAGYLDNVVLNETTYDFEEVYPVSGSITSPTAGQQVSGVFALTATYDDGDTQNDDAVQWAVRSGACAASTGTVAGNVDGRTDQATWDGQNFSYGLDTTSLDNGDYCFIFNPSDDPGQTNVRETVTFAINNEVVTTEPCEGDFDNTLVVTQNQQAINGTRGRDHITINGNQNSVRGLNGDDCIIVNGNQNSVLGNNGDDDIFVTGTSNSVNGNNGNDHIVAGSQSSVRGNNGDDYLEVGDGSVIHGNNGSDTCKVDETQSSSRSCEVKL